MGREPEGEEIETRKKDKKKNKSLYLDVISI